MLIFYPMDLNVKIPQLHTPNASGGTHVYMAFAEMPFKFSKCKNKGDKYALET